MIRSSVLAVSMFLPQLLVTASGEAGRYHAHVHGVAEMALALEGGNLEIEFVSPAASILGFEHQAVTPAEMAALADADAALRNTTNVFTFTGTRCELQAATVDMSGLPTGSTLEQRAQGVDRQARNEHNHIGHDHGRLAHGGEESHGNIRALYSYRCNAGDQLRAVHVGGDGLPFGLQTINVMWISDRAQGAVVLTAEAQVITLE